MRKLQHIETLQRSRKLDFAVGFDSLLQITSDGHVEKLPIESRKLRTGRPENLDCDGTIVQVAGMFSHFLLLGSAGEVYSVGSNDFGERGVEHVEEMSIPTLITHLLPSKIKTVAAGANSSAVVTTDGRLYTFGMGINIGQGGQSRTVPELVAAMDGYSVELISMGEFHSILAARDKPGRQHLLGFGDNSCMELGFANRGPSNSVSSPTLIPYFESHRHEVVQLAVGLGFSMALTLSGQVILWGTYGSGHPLKITMTAQMSYVYIAGGAGGQMPGGFAITDTGKTYSYSCLKEKEVEELRDFDVEHICVGDIGAFFKTREGDIGRLSFDSKKGRNVLTIFK